MSATSTATVGLSLLFSATSAFSSNFTDTNNFINYTFAENCSAIESFVAILSPSSLRDTLTTAQALFAPYSYHLESTELILLDDADNNACFDVNYTFSLVTDVSDKAVLVFSDDVCSDESKVFVLEQSGALTVLIAMDEDVFEVDTIPVDDELENLFDYEPSIPARMISEQDGWIIENYLNSNENTETLIIEISCYDNSYPPMICIVDQDDYAYTLDGEYVQEGSDILTYNDHPVYRKEGYFNFLDDLYMYLEESEDGDDTTDGWFWAISTEVGNSDDDAMVAYCTESTADPAACPSWMTINAFSNSNEFFLNEDVIVSDDVCNYTHSYVCAESDDYDAGGLLGTFKMENSQMALWYRELSETDVSPAILLVYRITRFVSYWPGYTFDYYFVIEDQVDGDWMAWCEIELGMYFGRPWECTTWYVVQNGVNEIYDSTFSVSNTQCAAEEPDPVTIDEHNDTSICLGGITENYEHLEGTYERVENLSTGHDVWYSKHLDENSEDFEAYIYYLGDFEPDLPWWVIASEIDFGDGHTIYGYCAAEVDHPSLCTGCWYLASRIYRNYLDPYCGVYLDAGSCPATNVTNVTASDVPAKLCVDTEEPAHSGTYARSESKVNGQFYWYQEVNIYNEPQNNSYFIVYEDVFKYWVFAEGLDSLDDIVFKCDSTFDGSNPANCPEWTDFYNIDTISIHVGASDCNITSAPTPLPTAPSAAPTAPTVLPSVAAVSAAPTQPDSIITPDETEEQSGSSSGSSSNNGRDNESEGDGEVAVGVILGVLGGLICCCLMIFAGVWICKSKNSNIRGKAGFYANNDEIEMDVQRKGMMMDDGIVAAQMAGTATATRGGGTAGNDEFGEQMEKDDDDDENEKNDKNESNDAYESDGVLPENVTTGIENENENENEKSVTQDGNENPTGWETFD